MLAILATALNFAATPSAFALVRADLQRHRRRQQPDTCLGESAVPLTPNAILAGIGNAATPVPEPETGVLMLAGLGALLARRRAARPAATVRA
jgi:hypothetical protein